MCKDGIQSFILMSCEEECSFRNGLFFGIGNGKLMINAVSGCCLNILLLPPVQNICHRLEFNF
jgi:hypothetical protein